jgi:phosphoribosylanthranilate isomerase
MDGTGQQFRAVRCQCMGRPVEWVLVDGMVGGSGDKFDWSALQPPRQVGQRGWFLAGGLGPQNVADAVGQLQPTGVDVSSGVTGPDKVRKDASKVYAFVSAVRSAGAVCLDS